MPCAAARRGESSAPHRPDLIVLGDVVVPDPADGHRAARGRDPHLIGYAHEGTAMVGPLVWPGRSSCLHCAELYRASCDLAWPKLAAQFVGQVATAGLACTQLAAALTAEQVLADARRTGGWYARPTDVGCYIGTSPCAALT